MKLYEIWQLCRDVEWCCNWLTLSSSILWWKCILKFGWNSLGKWKINCSRTQWKIFIWKSNEATTTNAHSWGWYTSLVYIQTLLYIRTMRWSLLNMHSLLTVWVKLQMILEEEWDGEKNLKTSDGKIQKWNEENNKGYGKMMAMTWKGIWLPALFDSRTKITTNNQPNDGWKAKRKETRKITTTVS